MLRTENFYFDILPQALRYFGVVIFAPAMHGLEALYPYGTTKAMTLTRFGLATFWASLAFHVFYNSLMEFPMNRADNRDGSDDFEFLGKGEILILGSMFFSEGIQDGLF
jgi:divalent metal cation (Fe/Co/Zn/Cd) transporter